MKLKVLVIGLGGFGLSALNEIQYKVFGPDLLILSNKIDDINNSSIKNKILLGNGVTTNHSKELGKRRIIESEAEINKYIKGYDVIIIITALGYGTGSGASPILAQMAKATGAFVIMLATTPYLFEGQNRDSVAKATIPEIKENVDSLIIISKQKLLKGNSKPQTGLDEKNAEVRNLARYFVSSIYDILTNDYDSNGINLLKKLFDKSNDAYFGVGAVMGEENALAALRIAANNNLMLKSLSNANKVLISINYKTEVSNDTLNLIYDEIYNIIGKNVEIIYTKVLNNVSLGILLISILAISDSTQASVTSEFDKLKDVINPNNLY